MKKIPIIDVFAGPGGLCEGFSRYTPDEGLSSPFDVAISVENDKFAWGTLRRRALYRHAFLMGSEGSKAVEKYFEYARKIVATRKYQSRCVEARVGANEIEYLEKFYNKTADKTLFPNGIENKTGTGPLDITKELTHQQISSAVARIRSNNDHWILIGGPPCQAYSLSGRSRMQGIDPVKFLEDHRHVLYKQYVRIIKEHSPSIFVMENVEGILSSPDPESAERRVFDTIRQIVSHPTGKKEEYLLYSLTTGKEIEDSRNFLVCAENYGIPQARHRVIIMGIRKDIAPLHGFEPLVQRDLASNPTTSDAIGDLPPIRSMISYRNPDNVEELNPEIFEGLDWERAVSKAITCLREKLSSDAYSRLKAASNDLPANLLTAVSNRGNGKMEVSGFLEENQEWFRSPTNGLILNHFSRSHKPSDLVRYLYISSVTAEEDQSPRMRDLIAAGLQPLHKSVKAAGNHDDRFKAHPKNNIAKTIVSHAGKDGHANIHYDPTQCRSLTVRETARIQTFPDDYLFEGPMVEQFKQVGNAVPPLLARQIAEIVFRLLG